MHRGGVNVQSVYVSVTSRGGGLYVINTPRAAYMYIVVFSCLIVALVVAECM